MATVVFSVTLLLEALLAGSLILTLLSSRVQIWPPPQRDSWQYWFTWSLTIASLAGLTAVGVLDWGSWVLDPWPWRLAGAALMLAGTAFALWAVRTLSLRTSMGLGGRLTTGGPYRFSRNPQYVGDIALTIGYALLCNSWMALAAGILGAVWFALAPFTEEPWLRARYGPDYERYLEQVPRFIGLPKSG